MESRTRSSTEWDEERKLMMRKRDPFSTKRFARGDPSTSPKSLPKSAARCNSDRPARSKLRLADFTVIVRERLEYTRGTSVQSRAYANPTFRQTEHTLRIR
ncbi:hypothetical protein RSOL_284230 [Rhizoctonia solani AG-3 Rhs1AP]|uniref:Uncharacterized protein n=2 Tax=Rhizoctonia solani AG-3 TaxID=1086053 RepID=A0A074S1Q0_9AGAM|nr:hypothetical protein RSOL_284230 [Rhizoctonia solani AG-3 Rhs1AP]KEP51495.1 hypothetical protein V565_060770 [Rhizoctonia solani 123E]